jgi:hypothetical protein
MIASIGSHCFPMRPNSKAERVYAILAIVEYRVSPYYEHPMAA